MIDKKLLEIIACPKCKKKVKYQVKPEEKFICLTCKLEYFVEEGIPVMIIEKTNKISR